VTFIPERWAHASAFCPIDPRYSVQKAASGHCSPRRQNA
jgi:hypothetical protein